MSRDARACFLYKRGLRRRSRARSQRVQEGDEVGSLRIGEEEPETIVSAPRQPHRFSLPTRGERFADTIRRVSSLLCVGFCVQSPDARASVPVAFRGVGGKIRLVKPLGPAMRRRPTLDGRQAVSTGLTRLLARLDPDPDRAAAEYERLRVTLEKFFDWQCAWPPEECADETLDRLARKLATEAQIGDVRAYARGIARLVLFEWRRRPAEVSMDERPEHAAMSTPPHIADDEAQALSACFERCLAALPADSRTLVLEYYVAERRAKIENRRRLAETLGVSESALRNRVQRVRNRIERCVQTCTRSVEQVGLEATLRQPLNEAPDEE